MHMRHLRQRLQQLQDALLWCEHQLQTSERERARLDQHLTVLLDRNAVLAEDNSILRAKLQRRKTP